VRFQVRGRDRLFSTRLSEIEDLPLAKARAKAEIDRAYSLGADATSSPRKYASLGEIVAAYQPLGIGADTAQQNRAAFLRVVRIGLQTPAPETLSAKCLESDDVAGEYQRRILRAAAERDFQEQQSARVTINTTLRKARSLFKPEHLHCYRDLGLPDLKRFKATPPLKVDADMSFVPFPAGVLERIDALIDTLPRNLRLAAILMRWLGLRNCEVEHAKWEWFRRHSDGTATLTVERWPYFKVKNNSVRTIELPRDLVARLDPFWGAPDDWVIALPTATDRFDLTHDELNKVLRPLLPERQKCSYELRKHAGSEVLTLPESEGGGLAAAARFLGDSIQITEKHYARYQRTVRALSAEQSRAQFRMVVGQNHQLPLASRVVAA
jgi:hypothetical protein